MDRWTSSSWYRSLLTEPPFLTEPPMTSCTCRIRPSSTRCGLHDPSGVVHVLELVVACWGPIAWQDVSALAQSCTAGRRAVAAGPLLLEMTHPLPPAKAREPVRNFQVVRTFGPAIQLLTTYDLSDVSVLSSCSHLRRLHLWGGDVSGLLEVLPPTLTVLDLNEVEGVLIEEGVTGRLPKLQLLHYMPTYNVGELGAIVDLLPSTPDLRVLALPNVEAFGDDELAAVVAHCPRLHTLQLEGTGVTEVGWRSLLDETALPQLRAADYRNEAYECPLAGTMPWQWFWDERRGMPKAPAWEYVDAELKRCEQSHLTEEGKMKYYFGTEAELDANIVKYFAYLRAVLWRGLFAITGHQIGEHHYSGRHQWEHELLADQTLLEASYPNVEMRDGKRRSVPIS